ncbi:MAG: NADH-quinone oxidoreductase subunit C [Planctomycetes bacterium]|nr:NADH-quinone oxidoreductase subunit C [Planctomycetota bacterium]
MKSKVDRFREALGERCRGWRETTPRRAWATVDPGAVPEVCRLIFEDLRARFAIITGIDAPGGFEILYHFEFPEEGRMVTIEARIPGREHPEIDSVTPIIPGAGFIEREIAELLGVTFRGHPQPEHLLLDDTWPAGVFPLRKDRGNGQGNGEG